MSSGGARVRGSSSQGLRKGHDDEDVDDFLSQVEGVFSPDKTGLPGEEASDDSGDALGGDAGTGDEDGPIGDLGCGRAAAGM